MSSGGRLQFVAKIQRSRAAAFAASGSESAFSAETSPAPPAAICASRPATTVPKTCRIVPNPKTPNAASASAAPAAYVRQRGAKNERAPSAAARCSIRKTP